MGLDMYLTKKTYIGAEWEHRDVKGTIDITIKGEPVKINFNRVQSIEEKIGYWRKANQIHNWFVQNVQDGEDDCKEYDVSRDKLVALLADVNKVLDARATHKPEALQTIVEEVLPPADGCFFGSTEIDEWYWQDLEYTKEMLTNLIEEVTLDNLNPAMWTTIHYQSSW